LRSGAAVQGNGFICEFQIAACKRARAKDFKTSLQGVGVLCILPRMQIQLVSIGQKMPAWVQLGFDEYAKRMPRECELVLKEIAAGKRTKNSDVARIVKEEGERMLSAIAKDSHVVTLEVTGKLWSTPELSQAMQRWLGQGRNVALLVGGPEGLSDDAKSLANESWSLSRLTFPHPLVRVMIAEQIYRAWTLLNNHPYHRE
jgi:23S rRNA (pseudouridine1915-N3)-methyltransferase